MADAGRARFGGRVCLVTGGGRGIGRAVAHALAEEGAAVAVGARTRAQCEAVADELRERGADALALALDVADPASCAAAVAACEQALGPPSLVVHAAGISPVRDRAERHDPAVFAQIVHVNLAGAHAIAHAAAPSLLAHGGAIVNVASAVGLAASPRLAGYGASKAGVIQLTRTLAREWADRGVRVNAVCPGYVETELTAAMLAVDHIREEVVGETPLGRLARMEEVVEPVLFLASDAASYITGAALAVDGGIAA